MLNDDSIKLLSECDAGIIMGINSLKDVRDDIKDFELADIIDNSIDTHKLLKEKVEKLLDENNDDGKMPSAVAETMSWMKTNIKLIADNTDATVADLITDGCSMGVKSISRYINQYTKAEPVAVSIAKNLRDIEEELEIELREYL